MKRLRVIHVLYRMGAGGTELAVRRVVGGLDPERFENIICTVAPLSDVQEVPGARIISLARKSRRTGSLFADLSRFFLQENPDVVHSRNWGAIEAVVAAKLTRVPRIIHSEHGRDITTMHGDPWRRRIFRRFCYAMADEVFAVSRELCKHYATQLGINAKKIAVIPNGVDTSRFRSDVTARAMMRSHLGLKDDAIVVGTVGRLDPVKDHTTLLCAAEQLAANGSHIHVVIVGDGPEAGILHTRVETSAGLRGRVHLVGESNRPEDWINAFDIFVLPSLSEGMSNTILEAMATKLPCVVTRVGANPDLVVEDHTGFVVEARDESGIADRIRLLASDRRLRETLGRSGRERVEKNFSLNHMLENYTRLYTAGETRQRLARAALSKA